MKAKHKIYFAVIFLTFSLTACDSHSSKKKMPRIVTAVKEASINNLYYSGTVQPLHTTNVISPVDGVVEKMLGHYGNWVQAKQQLVVLRSSKSQRDYISALISFLKDKDQYLRSKDNFSATEELYKAGIVDKESYYNERSQVEANKLSYVTAANALRHLTQNMSKEKQDFEALSLQDITAYENTLQKEYNEFTVEAPVTGIFLAAEKNQTSSSNDKPLTQGGEVKEGEILFSVGDMSGVAAIISVNETDITQINHNQPAILTIPALPGLILQGKVVSVARQAVTSGGQSSASFPVHIEVPTITDSQRHLIRIGMTVKVDIEIHQAPQIKIPIRAVFEKNGINRVMLLDSKTKKPREVIVETGATDTTQVVINSGLRAGDQVFVNDD